MRRERDRMRRAVRIFVPREIAQQIEQNASLTDIEPETVVCGCVATDAANYTPLSETMSSEQLARFLNQYYRALFQPVAVHGGFVSDIVGDAMLAIWKSKGAEARSRMLRALLEMRDAAQQFNEENASNRLMTRFGVEWGPVTLTAVGALDHYEYRAVGVPVNVAARIQELNKKLGTRILVSRASLGESVGEFLVRDVGTFLLRGTRFPTQVCELIATNATASDEQRELAGGFGAALKLVFEGRSVEALAALGDLQVRHPADGPTRFYIDWVRSGVDLQLGAVPLT
jgi:adenylate cyclase